MKKSLLSERIASEAAIETVAAERAVNIILSGIVESLRQNGEVSLGDFGTFKLSLVTDQPQDPTQSNLTSKNKNTVDFIAGDKLNNIINKTK